MPGIAADIWPKLGIRFVTVDALMDIDSGYDSSGYYRRFGFLLTKPDHPIPKDGFNTMFLDILPFVEALKKEQNLDET